MPAAKVTSVIGEGGGDGGGDDGGGGDGGGLGGDGECGGLGGGGDRLKPWHSIPWSSLWAQRVVGR